VEGKGKGRAGEGEGRGREGEGEGLQPPSQSGILATPLLYASFVRDHWCI